MFKIRHTLAAITMVAGFQTHAVEPVTVIRAPISSLNNQFQTGHFDIDLDVNPSWLHHITEINLKSTTITLEDGSQWKLGMVYGGVLKQWQVGDEVTLSWYQNTIFLDTQIKNNTQHAYAWSNFYRSPQPEASGFLYIAKVPNRMTLVLSDGTQVKSENAATFKDFNEGDVLVTLYGKGTGSKTRYSLWDLTGEFIAYDLKAK